MLDVHGISPYIKMGCVGLVGWVGSINRNYLREVPAPGQVGDVCIQITISFGGGVCAFFLGALRIRFPINTHMNKCGKYSKVAYDLQPISSRPAEKCY